MELEEAMFKNYMQKREGAELTVHKIENKLFKSLQKVGHSYSRDGFLHFGDKLMLWNLKTKGFLVCDIWDRIPGGEEAYAVTASGKVQQPVARAVFVLSKLSEDKSPDSVLKYGQQFRLCIHPRLQKRMFYLHSCPISTQHCARFSRHQEVSMFHKAIYNTVWACEHIDVKLRFETLGQPVTHNMPVLLKHCATGHWLAADEVPYANDYGTEWEVSVHSFLTAAKTQQLSSEKGGKLTTDIPSRRQSDQNVWMVVTASDPSQEDELPEVHIRTAEDVIKEVRQILLERGAYGIRGLARVFRNMDENNSKTLDPEDFKWGLYNYGICLEDSEIRTLIEYFDRNKDGIVNFDEFLVGLRGTLNKTRRQLIAQAYQKLDKNGDGQVTLEDIALIYDASRHPEVIEGSKTAEQVFQEFMAMWDTQVPDGVVTLEEFMDYYRDVSASIDRDDYFELMIRQAWKL